MIYLFRMTDIRPTKYLHRKRPNPYLGDDPIPNITGETPFPSYWDGNTNAKDTYENEIRIAVLQWEGTDVCNVVARKI